MWSICITIIPHNASYGLGLTIVVKNAIINTYLRSILLSSAMKKIVFLDLEDTVIDEFWKADRANLMNIARVRAFLAHERPDAVQLFSFALGGDETVAQFRAAFEARLSEALGVAFDLAAPFTTEKLFRLCRRHGTVFEDEHECMLFHGKEMGFQRFIEMSHEFDNTEVVLVDDSVDAKEIRMPRRNLTIRMVNVNDLPH